MTSDGAEQQVRKHVAHLYRGHKKIGAAFIPVVRTGWPSVLVIQGKYFKLALTIGVLDEENRHQARYTLEVPYVVDDKDVYLR